MRETFELLRTERRARLFFVALAQSAIGAGAGYVALLLIAYDRFRSPWAVSLVLIAGLLPAMALGPVFGALADRWSRKMCIVTADVVRMIAFAGVALVDGFVATALFALVAGIGTGLFTPAALASLPSVVDDKRHTPATVSLYGIVADLGLMLGPALGAGLLALGGPTAVMGVNSATFGASAILLARLSFGAAPGTTIGGASARPSLVEDVKEGLRTVAGMRGIRIVLLGSGAALVCAGLFNVAEMFFVKHDLGANDAAFSLVVAAFGIGFVAGSLVGSKGGQPPLLKRRYLTGLLAMGLSLVLIGSTPTLLVAGFAFAFAGFGNGLLLVYERLLIQAVVADRLVGRVFGLKDALTAWAFGIAFLSGGGLVATFGARELLLAAGGVALLIGIASVLALRREWREGEVRTPSERSLPAAADSAAQVEEASSTAV